MESIPEDKSDSLYQKIRRSLKSIGFVRSTWYFLLVIKDSVGDTQARTETLFARTFEDAIDPWHFDTEHGRERFVRIVQMLDRVSPAKQFEHALEIGCAEGAFTEYLVDRCGSLMALDLAPLALERARQRRNWPTSVDFRQWDIRQNSILAEFDLIVVMDVLSYIFRPAKLRAAIEKIVDSLVLDGYLVVSDPRQTEIFETAWWGRLMIRGGVRIREYLAAHPKLTMIESYTSDTHAFGLFRKRGTSPPSD